MFNVGLLEGNTCNRSGCKGIVTKSDTTHVCLKCGWKERPAVVNNKYYDLFGSLADESCGRGGCKGIIERYDDDTSCSCHSNPPCSHCTDATYICPVCDWDEREEADYESVADYAARVVPLKMATYVVPLTHNEKLAKLDKTKISWVSCGHTHFSMIKEGVCPVGTTQSEVRKLVDGTFGGRFETFDNGKFKFIAYTD